MGEAQETVLAVLGPRDFLTEMSIIECVTPCASIRAVEETFLVALKSSDLYRLFQRQPDQYSIRILNIARDLSRRFRALVEVFSVVSQ